jgi:carboxyl-terminal processing protease
MIRTPVSRQLASRVLALAVFVFSAALSLQAQSAEVIRSAQKFERFLDFLDDKYLEAVDLDSLVEIAIVGVLEDLDPHSNYFSVEELEEANEPLVGNFEGIGIQFNILRDTIMVLSTITGGPSEKVGLQAGDKILTVNGEPVAGVGIKNQGVMDRLRGPKGTEVAIELERDNRKKPLAFTITRDKIPLYSVDAGYMADPKTGYIKVNRFAATTADEFREDLNKLKAQGMENLILDLRGNSGGYLNTAMEISNELLGGRKLIVYTEGRAYPRQNAYADETGGWTTGKLVVLIDEGSASASEIVSGAVQDWDRGLIIGRRSFGKGLVQRPFNLPDGSAVRLTVQRYYTPSGRSIQRPYEEGKTDYYKETWRRLESGELTEGVLGELPDSLKYFTQHNKRVVYGGGGILPDVFIGLDTSFVSDFFDDVLGKGILNQFAISYVNKHRALLKERFPTPEAFASQYNLEMAVWEEFIAYAAAEEVPYEADAAAPSVERLELLLEAMIARNLWDLEAYFMVTNRQDPAFLRAVEVMSDGTFEQMKIVAR